MNQFQVENTKDINSLLCSTPKNKPAPLILKKTVQIEKTEISYVGLQPNHVEEHSDPHLKIAIPLKQTAIHVKWQTETGKQRYQFIKNGNISIVSPDLPHETWIERSAEMIIINLHPKAIERVSDELNLKSARIIPQWTANKDRLIEQLGIALQAEFQQGKPTNIYVESISNLLLVHLLRHYSTTDSIASLPSARLSPQKLQQTRSYLQENLERSVSLSELAGVVELSPSRFARAFKQTTGTSPHKYIVECKIAKAKELLKNPQLSIADISYTLNFSSQSHFTSVFRRLTGTTPHIYRQNS